MPLEAVQYSGWLASLRPCRKKILRTPQTRNVRTSSFRRSKYPTPRPGRRVCSPKLDARLMPTLRREAIGAGHAAVASRPGADVAFSRQTVCRRQASRRVRGRWLQDVPTFTKVCRGCFPQPGLNLRGECWISLRLRYRAGSIAWSIRSTAGRPSRNSATRRTSSSELLSIWL